MKKLQETFDKTCQLLFSQPLGQLEKYEGWLCRHVPLGRLVKCKGKTLIVPDYGGILKKVPNSRVRPPEDFDAIGMQKLAIAGQETVQSMKKKMDLQTSYVVDFQEGDNFDNEQCTFFRNLLHSYRVLASFNNKCLAYSSWSDFSESSFGLYRTFYSKLCINCYQSSKLSCCLEMESCNSCSYSYFCHNCENLQDCILCFNVKNLQYAVGNVVVGREKFMQVKKELQSALVSELKVKHKVERSIYNLLG